MARLAAAAVSDRPSPGAARHPLPVTGEGESCPVRAASAAELRAWAGRARPGERFVYFSGPALVQGPAARAAAAMYRAGLVDLPPARRTGDRASSCFEWSVERIGPRGGRGRRAPLAVRDAAAARILAVLRRAAGAGRPCPSDTQLARIGRLATRDQAQWRVRKLEAEGRIRTEIWPGPDGPWRVVEIVASGLRTALPRRPGDGSAQPQWSNGNRTRGPNHE